jgi:hypothetical protein
VKRDVDTVLTYPAVMGSVFVLALQTGESLCLAVVAACVVVVLAALRNQVDSAITDRPPNDKGPGPLRY